MTTPDALLARVLDDPTDDAVRLGYADCLDDLAAEKGEPVPSARAELIRVQVALARLPEHLPNCFPGARCGLHDCPRCSLETRESREFAAAGLDQSRCYAGGYPVRVFYLSGASGGTAATNAACLPGEYRRGFVASVHCTLADWLAHAPAVLAAHPVERVEIADVPGLTFEVVQVPRRGPSPGEWRLVGRLDDPGGPLEYSCLFPRRAQLVTDAAAGSRHLADALRSSALNPWRGRVGPVHHSTIG